MFETCLVMFDFYVYAIGTVVLMCTITMLMLAARGRIQNNRISLITMAVTFESGNDSFDNDVMEFEMKNDATIPSRGDIATIPSRG